MRILNEFKNELAELKKIVSTENGQWSVKGFIDLYRNIYTISNDTKVISKVLEIAIFPHLLKFASENNYEILPTPHQNYYPDITLIDKVSKEKYAIDLKTTYRKSKDKVNGMTLGAFTGYFRDRSSKKNILFPYDDYKEHFILGVIYTRTDFAKTVELLNSNSVKITGDLCDKLTSYLSEPNDDSWDELIKKFPNLNNLRKEIDLFCETEFTKFQLDDLDKIQSVATNFEFFFVEKWKIAKTIPGSGNTKNIGGVDNIEKLLSGAGPFTELNDGKSVFNDYWIHYETKDMATKNGRSKPLYSDLAEYQEWRNR